jgi:hypothetical protein
MHSSYIHVPETRPKVFQALAAALAANEGPALPGGGGRGRRSLLSCTGGWREVSGQRPAAGGGGWGEGREEIHQR